MNDALQALAQRIDLAHNARLSLQFCYACAVRVRHLLEDDAVIECLDPLGYHVAGRMSADEFLPVQALANRLANQHRGSKSIDGCGHAAVSATYAVANAVNGKALDAASYAAYAQVYASGGYAAVADRESFEPEFAWQVALLEQLVAAEPV